MRATTPPIPPLVHDRAGAAEPAGTAPLGTRRRWTALLALVVVVAAVLVLLDGSDAGAELADPVAGHVVVAPGETLWDVAVETAPEGVDAREQVRALQELNGLDGADLPAWTVLLLPSR
ncbi:MAG: LysM peptidoglycan-binding domain-containing protein [Nitriliruptoraceae bacterium]